MAVPVLREWPRKVHVPFGTSVYITRGRPFNGRWSVECSTSAFFTKFVTLVAHRYLTKLFASYESVCDSTGRVSHAPVHIVPHMGGISRMPAYLGVAPVFTGGWAFESGRRFVELKPTIVIYGPSCRGRP